ncbi:MAG: ribonuclease BN-like protein, partial [Desulfuromonas sp.]
MTWQQRLEKARGFVGRDLWEIEGHHLGSLQRLWLRLARLVVLVVRDFIRDRCMLRASALTYTTLLSIVPLFALMFALLKGLGVQNKVEPFLLERIAVGSEEIVGRILTYIDRTNVGSLGVAGLFFLVMTVLTLLSNIEESFNHVWGVKETRPLFRRFADYFSLVTIGPLFMLVAISMTTSLQSQTLIQALMGYAVIGKAILLFLKVTPYLVMWAAFTVLYLFMPNIKVQFQAALVGGILGGTLWQIAQWGYIHFQVGVAKYNAIYGTMAALPIFLVWIYVSWLIVLVGLELSYAWQNLRMVQQEMQGEDFSEASREVAALAIMVTVAQRFYRGEEPLGLEEIATLLDLPPRLVRGMLERLVRLQLLCEVSRGGQRESGYHPGRALESIDVAGALKMLRDDGPGYDSAKVGAAGV